ncbi:MAG: XRE family aerobic/anaerobic benzoate catabolism transcriptional regulator [Myxococcota bacterium]|jgi:XRE family aerobic/anaerobic benzoate catabolism transcriptional regulator
MLLDVIGTRLRERRLELGMTQAGVARDAGVSPRFLVQLEGGRGNISVNRLADVCSTLDLQLEQLFRGLGPGGPEKLALVGMRGAGKSTIGAAIAARLSMPFIEIDARVAETAGMSLSGIFEVGGSGLYRELERQVLVEVLAEAGPAVLATGGSVVSSVQSWQLLRNKTRTVWLRAAPRSHLDRVIAQGDLRPIAGRPDALRELTEILTARQPLYAMAAITLDTDALGIDGVVERLAALGEEPG